MCTKLFCIPVLHGCGPAVINHVALYWSGNCVVIPRILCANNSFEVIEETQT